MVQLTAVQSRELQSKDSLVLRDENLALNIFEREQVVAVDTETSGLSPWKDRIAVVTLNGQQSGVTAVLHVRGGLSRRLINFFNDPTKLFIGHNLVGFDLLFFAIAGVDIHSATWYDTLIGEQVCKMTDRRDVRFSLKASTLRQLGVQLKKDADHAGWMNPTLNDSQVDYCADDVKYIHELRTAQFAKAAEKGLEPALTTEMSLVPIVAQMTLNGLPINLERLRSHLAAEEERTNEALYSLWDTFGPINFGSSKQVLGALASIGLDLRSSSATTLKELISSGADQVGYLKDIIQVREGKKRTNQYSDEWIAKYVAADGCIHPRYWICGADTGRFTCSDPNMQQWPVNMRWVISAPPNHRFLMADFKSAEVVVAAAISNDSALLSAIKAGGDLHRNVGSQVFGVTPEAITTDQRKLAKAMNFCLLFGGWYQTFYEYARLAGSNITLEEAKTVEEQYFMTYRGIAAMKYKAEQQSRRGGPVMMRLPTGLKRNLLPSTSGRVAKTKILNTAVQGTAAAGMKFALIEAYKRGLIATGIAGSVHDEIAGAIPSNQVEEVARELDESMVAGMKEAVSRMMPGAECPISVDIKIGDDWRKE
jgi:DNA polymerase I-like protein with 3'-5' exonuclease and polymerase domains